MALHGLDQHRAGSTAREWLDQRGRQRIDKAGIPAKPVKRIANTVQTELKGSRGTQYADGAEHCHQIGQQALGDVKPFFGALNEGFIHLDPLESANQQKEHDQSEQGQVAHD